MHEASVPVNPLWRPPAADESLSGLPRSRSASSGVIANAVLEPQFLGKGASQTVVAGRLRFRLSGGNSGGRTGLRHLSDGPSREGGPPRASAVSAPNPSSLCGSGCVLGTPDHHEVTGIRVARVVHQSPPCMPTRSVSCTSSAVMSTRHVTTPALPATWPLGSSGTIMARAAVRLTTVPGRWWSRSNSRLRRPRGDSRSTSSRVRAARFRGVILVLEQSQTSTSTSYGLASQPEEPRGMLVSRVNTRN